MRFKFETLKKPAFWIAILGAVKVVASSFGYELFQEDQIETIANGVAAIVTVVGVTVSYE